MKEKHVNHTLNRLIPIADELLEMEVPYLGVVSAGFPSEAYNYMEEGIDFNKLLVKRRETTFCLVAGGDCLSGDGISDGDLLVIDKLEEPYQDSILVFSIDGIFRRYGGTCLGLLLQGNSHDGWDVIRGNPGRVISGVTRQILSEITIPKSKPKNAAYLPYSLWNIIRNGHIYE